MSNPVFYQVVLLVPLILFEHRFYEDTNFEEEPNQDLQTPFSLTNNDFGSFSDFTNDDDAVITSSESTLEIINQQIVNEIRQDNNEGDSETKINRNQKRL